MGERIVIEIVGVIPEVPPGAVFLMRCPLEAIRDPAQTHEIMRALRGAVGHNDWRVLAVTEGFGIEMFDEAQLANVGLQRIPETPALEIVERP